MCIWPHRGTKLLARGSGVVRGGRVQTRQIGFSRRRAEYIGDAHHLCQVYTRFRRLRVETDLSAVSRKERRARKAQQRRQLAA